MIKYSTGFWRVAAVDKGNGKKCVIRKKSFEKMVVSRIPNDERNQPCEAFWSFFQLKEGWKGLTQETNLESSRDRRKVCLHPRYHQEWVLVISKKQTEFESFKVWQTPQLAELVFTQTLGFC
jgi:hypothetical protein